MPHWTPPEPTSGPEKSQLASQAGRDVASPGSSLAGKLRGISWAGSPLDGHDASRFGNKAKARGYPNPARLLALVRQPAWGGLIDQPSSTLAPAMPTNAEIPETRRRAGLDRDIAAPRVSTLSGLLEL